MGFFSLLRVILRRLVSQWRLALSLFLGLLVAAAVVTAIPLYTNGSLEDSMQKDWSASASGGQPGDFSLSIPTSSFGMPGEMTSKDVLRLTDYLLRTVPGRIHRPLLASGWSSCMNAQLELPDPANPEATMTADIQVMTGLDKLATMAEGRMPSATVGPDGVVEVACAVAAADALDLIVGRTYHMSSEMLAHPADYEKNTPAPTVPLAFSLVGTFNLRKDKLSSPAWITNPDFSQGLFVNPQVFLDYLVGRKEVSIYSVELTWIIDPRTVRVSDLTGMIKVLNNIDRDTRLYDERIYRTISPSDFFATFGEKQKALRLMMLALAVPTLVLILYYVVLMAGLIVDQRRGEIALMRSRGASTAKLVFSFALEWTVLGILCLICGPPLGMFLTQVMGASAGFLSFVDRRALPVVMTTEAYSYAALLALVMIAAATIPAARACRHSMVSYKQDQSRSSSKPIWQKYLFDLVLLGVGIFGYRALLVQAQAKSQAVSDLVIDPLLFVVPILLIMALGLFLLRIMPLAAGWIEKLLSRGRSISAFSSLLELARNPGRYRPLILLVVLTTATGIYGAAIARTLDENARDRAYYAVGADVTLKERWYRLIPDTQADEPLMGPVPMKEDTSRPFEPSFLVHMNAPGVLAAARVQKTTDVGVSSGSTSFPRVTVMALNPIEFAHTAWFRPGLNAGHQNLYLNMLVKYPQAALVSRAMIDDGRLKLGDCITMQLNRENIDFVIAGAVDFWPSLDPQKGSFVIANLDYVTAQSSIAPYQVWLKLAPDGQLSRVLKYLSEHNVSVAEAVDARHELTLFRRDPQRMGLFGIISIGFCVAVLFVVVGLFFYTFVTIRHRFLQFGVLRAIGLSMRQLVAMLVLEQIWSVGAGLLSGTLLGQGISMVFVPLIKSATSMTGEVPPFHVVVSGADIRTIYLVLLPALLLALVALGYILGRLQVYQAIKLGEDA